ncbi:ABC transporter substrate-binding protein [Phytohabitans sp. ZYX-F-186]|uniref:ABC transporter substrate-binding protein n=1 Tax=Phytohabitans maris TaxID=3071409 RepID=A0ABU0ZAH3_9ACTN|nr:ABC transporter substrate-binding protein [Phytohabitans sp. ZYX-F-186]MDQ7904034.1 ABC transporter substrate-binding protein [Phytohabitans sp. ZYX-F-186]
MATKTLRRAAATLAIGLVAGCGGTSGGDTPAGAGADQTAIFKYGIPGNPTSLDPRRSGPLDPIFLNNFYDSLVRRMPNGDLKPGLATEWTFTPDAKALEFTLRTGVTFQDGTPFDAGAVKANIEAAKQPPSVLVGALSAVSSVDVVSPTRVRLNLSVPGGHLVNTLAGEAGMMISPAKLASDDLKANPAGTGPYKLAGIADGKLSLRPWEGYWNKGAVKNGGIDMTVYSDESTRLRALRSGQSDGTTITPAQIAEAKSAGLTIITGPNTTFNGILLNTKQSEFGNPKVRQAISYAIDRKAISDSLYAGACVPSVQPYQKNFWAYNPALEYKDSYYDEAKAKALLAEAGLPNGFEFEMLVGPNTSYQQLGQAIQGQLEKVGIRMKLTVVEFTQMTSVRRTGKFAATVALVQAGRPDPSQFIADFYTTGGLYNPGNFSTPGVSELLTESRRTDDPASRAKPTQEIVAKVLEAGPPVIPVCGVAYVAAFRSGVSGLEVPINGDYDFSSVTIGR